MGRRQFFQKGFCRLYDVAFFIRVEGPLHQIGSLCASQIQKCDWAAHESYLRGERGPARRPHPLWGRGGSEARRLSRHDLRHRSTPAMLRQLNRIPAKRYPRGGPLGFHSDARGARGRSMTVSCSCHDDVFGQHATR